MCETAQSSTGQCDASNATTMDYGALDTLAASLDTTAEPTLRGESSEPNRSVWRQRSVVRAVAAVLGCVALGGALSVAGRRRSAMGGTQLHAMSEASATAEATASDDNLAPDSKTMQTATCHAEVDQFPACRLWGTPVNSFFELPSTKGNGRKLMYYHNETGATRIGQSRARACRDHAV